MPTKPPRATKSAVERLNATIARLKAETATVEAKEEQAADLRSQLNRERHLHDQTKEACGLLEEKKGEAENQVRRLELEVLFLRGLVTAITGKQCPDAAQTWPPNVIKELLSGVEARTPWINEVNRHDDANIDRFRRSDGTYPPHHEWR